MRVRMDYLGIHSSFSDEYCLLRSGDSIVELVTPTDLAHFLRALSSTTPFVFVRPKEVGEGMLSRLPVILNL